MKWQHVKCTAEMLHFAIVHGGFKHTQWCLSSYTQPHTHVQCNTKLGTHTMTRMTGWCGLLDMNSCFCVQTLNKTTTQQQQRSLTIQNKHAGETNQNNANLMKKNKLQCRTSMRQQIENVHMRMQMSSKDVIHNCALMIAHFH